ncbi:hypothetical protein HUJ05_012808 [Dendroctonus ponderosae]|nr:hypothetical protein HUJ05_008662 [Dendroctonus ponderosae]KAH1015025.1 hypothetical protein HUJ05_012808 [Dendroctonus ponderosae]
MNWLVVLIASSSIFVGTTSGTLQACYNCVGSANSTCGTGDFNSSDSNIFVSDCLQIYHYANTTEAVCVTLSGPTAIPKYNGSDITYRLCLPKLINDIELCQYVTENKTYTQSQYGFNVTNCKTCTSDFCNGSPAYVGSVAAVILRSSLADLKACYGCSGGNNSACASNTFNTSSEEIYISDCLKVYHLYNTTEAVCLKVVGWSDDDSNIVQRSCAPKTVGDTEVCEYLTKNNTYTQLYGINGTTTCNTCTSDYCNGSTSHLGSAFALFLSIFTIWHLGVKRD